MEKASEYCMLWVQWWPLCMSRTDWAAWIQAVGSILAIGGAFWLGERQARTARLVAERQMWEARRLEADKRHLDDRLKTEVVQQLFGDALQVVTKLHAAPDRLQQGAGLQHEVDRANELEAAFRALPLFDMPGAAVAVGVAQAPKLLGDLRTAATTCMNQWVLFRGLPGTPLPTHIVSEFQRAEKEATSHFQVGLQICEHQIAKLQKLMPVDD